MEIAVVGGGVGGCMAAGLLARRGYAVTLFEGGEKLLKKMFITGKGRCNLTNLVDSDEFLRSVVSNPKFLFSSLRQFDSYACYSFFEMLGVQLKVERGNRVFPASDKSSDITKKLAEYASKSKVLLNTKVQDITKSGDIFSIATGSKKYNFDRVVLCTGGASYRATGSTGDGYKFAEKFGHTVVPIAQALVGIDTVDEVADMAGLTLKNVTLTAMLDNKVIFSEMGEMLITHTGISGPLTLTLSSKINRLKVSQIKLFIDLKPALSVDELDARIMRDFAEIKNKEFKNSLSKLLPQALIDYAVEKSGIPRFKQVNSITKEERLRLASLIKNLPFTPSGLADINGAIITAGGVKTSEIDPKTMQSKIVEGLYFAGELIDVDALTGGFNIQVALSTAYAVGQNLE